MTDVDFEPTNQPTSTLLRDAIQKGLGRAQIWAKANEWTEGLGILRDACLTDMRYDRQTEEPRGPWLWQILETVGAVDTFREGILESLGTLNDGLAAQQLCQFCVCYARLGDERFQTRLREIVATKPVTDCPWLGEEELIALEGETGFLFAAKTRGQTLSRREWEWDDASLVDRAIEKLSEPAVVALLDREALCSTDVRRFRDGWRNGGQREPTSPRQSHTDRMREYKLDNVIRAAEGARNQAGFLRGWGMYANERDLQLVLDRLLACVDPAATANYLRVFSNRSLAHFDERMLGLLGHEDEKVRSRAYTAVAQNAHPAIRKYAVDQLAARIADPNFIELFVNNYRPGDEDDILTHLQVPDDMDQCHWLLMDVVKVLERNPTANCRSLSLCAYRWTPCGACRSSAAALLFAQHVAPDWLVQECQHDCVGDTRALAKEPPVAD